MVTEVAGPCRPPWSTVRRDTGRTVEGVLAVSVSSFHSPSAACVTSGACREGMLGRLYLDALGA